MADNRSPSQSRSIDDRQTVDNRQSNIADRYSIMNRASQNLIRPGQGNEILPGMITQNKISEVMLADVIKDFANEIKQSDDYDDDLPMRESAFAPPSYPPSSRQSCMSRQSAFAPSNRQSGIVRQSGISRQSNRISYQRSDSMLSRQSNRQSGINRQSTRSDIMLNRNSSRREFTREFPKEKQRPKFSTLRETTREEISPFTGPNRMIAEQILNPSPRSEEANETPETDLVEYPNKRSKLQKFLCPCFKL